MTEIVDGHHHIWRQADLPWLTGPMQPRIFGPYEPIRRDYPIQEYLDDLKGTGFTRSVYVQTNWANERFEDEAAWVQQTADEHGWPHAIIAYANFAVEDVRPQLDRLSRYSLVRGVRMQLHWHENPLYRFAARPDLCVDPMIRRNVARLSDYGWSFDLQVFTPQMPDAAELAEACPKVTFILQHAGMLEDLSPAGRAAWRAGMARLATCPNVVSKLSGLGTFIHRNDPAHIAAVLADTVAIFGAGAACWLQFPDRGFVDQLSRARRRVSRGGLAVQCRAAGCDLQRDRDARLPARAVAITDKKRKQGGKRMALEIKILDYGDIELESSFLVLGRDCGRTRRVLTLGFLILGGPYPVVVDTGYRSNQIMETLGMRGLQYHENMIENQLARHGVRMGDVRFVCHTHLHIDHAGKDDLFPMNTTVVVNRRELEYSVSGLMHPQYPAPDVKHLIDRLHTRSALRFLDLEITGPIELMPGVYCDAANAHTEGSMNIIVHTADGIATICGDVIYDINDQIVTPFNEIHDWEPRTTGNHGTTKRAEKAAIKKLLSNSRYLLPVHDRPAKIEGGNVVGRLHDQVPGPIVQSLPQRNWFPA